MKITAALAICAAGAAVFILTAIGAAARAIHIARAYMFAWSEPDDRAALLHTTQLVTKERLKYWLTPNKHKHCHHCCVFCEYFEGCTYEVSNCEAVEAMQEYLQELEKRLEKGEQLTDTEQQAYKELVLLDAEGKLKL